MANVQLGRKPVFLYNGTSGEIRSGWPEQFPAPPGFEKIVCTSASQTEQWSARQRKWDEFLHQIKMEEREMIEGPHREQIRSHLRHLMANAKNNVNRDFIARYLETSAAEGSKWKYRRESYLHCEAFEQGR